MKFITAPVKTIILIFVAFILSYYILMARQTIHLSQVITSGQFWLMLILGAVFFYGYFRYSEYLNRRIQHSSKYSIFVFLILRLLFGVWIPSVLVLFFLKQLFSLWGLNFNDSGYLDTEYFILMIILYGTTIGFVALYFFKRYQEVQVNANSLSPKLVLAEESSKPHDKLDESLNSDSKLYPEDQMFLKRELAEMLLHVVLIRKRKNNTVLFRDDGTCEVFISDPRIIDLFVQEETLMQINRWTWVNVFYIKDMKRENNEDSIIIDQELESKYQECKIFYEPNAHNQADDKPNLFVGRAYKKQVKLWIKENRGNIGA
ncbi:hypothetical protein [Sphingobacterium cavernae]|uniref:hypothetical protein n=1 Tax=Sphingobacterium cavernae TaxID=2592657 RepID=UPI00122FF723|nr:hypothetical protein [Sphingobacterium cavernae]